MILVAIPFLAFAAALVLAGLSQTFNAEHGQTDGGFTGFLQDVYNKAGLGALLGLATKAGRYVISRFATTQFRALTAYLNSVAGLWKAEFRAMRAEAQATTDVARALEHAIPIEAKRAAAPGLRLGKLNARQLARFRTEVRPALKRLSVAIDVTIPRDIAGIRHRERVLARDQAKLRERTGLLEDGAIRAWHWLRDHPFSAAMGAFTGVVAIALSTLGLDWIACRGRNSVNGKSGCNLWNDIEGLLGAAIVTGLALDLPTLIAEAQKVTPGIVDEIEKLAGLKS